MILNLFERWYLVECDDGMIMVFDVVIFKLSTSYGPYFDGNDCIFQMTGDYDVMVWV